MNLFLRYIYSDEVIINTISNALGLYCAAKKYMLPHLSQVCMKYMINNLKPNNVCQVYEIAKVFDETTLISRCIEVKKLSYFCYFFKFLCGKLE